MKLLIIEDHDIQFKLLKLRIGSSRIPSLELIRAKSLSESLELLDNNAFDLIVCDLILPDAKEYESIDAVYDKAGNIPIIVLTGKDDINDEQEILKKGAAHYVPKNSNYANIVNDVIIAEIEKMYSNKNENSI